MLTNRDEVYGGEPSTWNTWNGEGLLGPLADFTVEREPALWGTIPYAEFFERHHDLAGDGCGLWVGGELLGIGCEEACDAVASRCSAEAAADCEASCPALARAQIECLTLTDRCEAEFCKLED